jgi:integrase
MLALAGGDTVTDETRLTIRADDQAAALADLSLVSAEAAVRRPLAEVVEAALTATSKSRHTRRAYQTAIATFVDYLDAERGDMVGERVAATWRPFVRKRIDGDLLPVTQDTGRVKAEFVYSDAAAAVLRLVDAGLLDGYAAHRRGLGDSENTVISRLAAVRAFLSVALRDNVLTRDQAMSMGLRPYRARQRRDVQPVGRRLTKAEVRALLDAVDTSTTKGRRDLAMLCCMLYAGLRAEETANLRLSNLEMDKGRWWLTLGGKGRKTRKIKMHDVLFEALSDWTEMADLVDWNQDKAIFYTVTSGGAIRANRVTPTDVGRTVTAMGARAGLSPPSGPGRLGAHDLRRTAARNAYDNGGTLLQVQRLLGHSDPKTTVRYIGLGDEEGATAVDFIHY